MDPQYTTYTFITSVDDKLQYAQLFKGLGVFRL